MMATKDPVAYAALVLRLTHYDSVSQVYVWRSAADTHDDNECMLLDGKSTRVNVERESTERYPPARELFPCATNREDE